MKKIKTNVLRLLDQAHIPYYIKEFDYDDHGKPINGRCEMDISEDKTFKTLVLKGTKGYLVCCIPVIYEIDLKKLGSETGNKSVEMILQRELLPLTGYIHGGCSPIGMKKKFPTYIQKEVLDYEWIGVSAGKRGVSVVIKPNDLIKYTEAKIVDVIKK